MAAVTKDELLAEIADKKERLSEISRTSEGQRFDEVTRNEWNTLNTEVDELNEHVAELEAREARLVELAGKPENVERVSFPNVRKPGAVTGGDIYDLSTIERSWDDPSKEVRELHDRAMRAVEAATIPFEEKIISREDAQKHLERLLGDGEGGDRRGADVARHYLLTGGPGYKRAFTKYLSGEPRTQQEEVLLHRAASLTTTSGGFAVPFVLDPSIIPTSSGAINPYREIANVSQISVDEWRGVSSDGITAAFQAEAAAVTDATPTLAQPTVSTEMARAFVPFSIEIGMDWSGFATEMAGMLRDSKDVLEATKFAVGSGTNEPFGVITGATTVFTASDSDSLIAADIYGVHNALGPRFRGRSAWTVNNSILDKIRQIDTVGGSQVLTANLQLRSAAQATTMVDGRAGVDIFSHPVYEASGQSGAVTTGQLIAVVGDFNYYKIVDRIGLTIETIPHIFGASQGNLPTGQRGLFAYWRVGAKVLNANAFRTLKLA